MKVSVKENAESEQSRATNIFTENLRIIYICVEWSSFVYEGGGVSGDLSLT